MAQNRNHGQNFEIGLQKKVKVPQNSKNQLFLLRRENNHKNEIPPIIFFFQIFSACSATCNRQISLFPFPFRSVSVLLLSPCPSPPPPLFPSLLFFFLSPCLPCSSGLLCMSHSRPSLLSVFLFLSLSLHFGFSCLFFFVVSVFLFFFPLSLPVGWGSLFFLSFPSLSLRYLT